MHRGEDTTLEGLMVLTVAGCYGCDGPPSGIFRAYSYRGGAMYGWLLRTSPLGAITDINGHTLAIGVIRNIVSTQDSSVMAVSICIQGTCHPEGLDAFDPNSVTATFRSLDGGVTWQEIDRSGPIAGAVGAMRNGQVLIANAMDAAGASVAYVLQPGGATVTPPQDAVRAVVAEDAIAWLAAGGRIISADGGQVVKLSGFTEREAVTLVGTISGEKSSALVSWVVPSGAGIQQHVAVLENGTLVSPVLSDEPAYIGAWLPKFGRALITPFATGSNHPLPAFLDVSSGEYRLIPNPFNGGPSVDADTGRDIALAVQSGPFALVKGTGSCLNIRAAPSLSAEVITCMADGVLLRDNGETHQGDGGETWVSITTPGGTQGWASAAFLER